MISLSIQPCICGGSCLVAQEILPAEPTNCFVNMAVWVQRVRHEPVLHLDVNQLHHMHDPIVAAWNRLQRKSL